jgi:CRISPR-associated protein Cas5 subtype I-B
MIFIDIESSRAQFRNHFCNTSFVSYPFPPRITVTGIFASILGFDIDSYHRHFSDAQIAICIKSKKLYKATTTLNHREPTKYNQAVQVHSEYIRSSEGKVKYRLYYQGQLESSILNSLQNYNGYHLYLGVTECLADITDYGNAEYCPKSISDEYMYIDSVLPVDIISAADIFADKFDSNLKYDRSITIYGWKNSRGNSLGPVSLFCEMREGIIKCKLKKDLSFVIAKLQNGSERKVHGELIETDKNDLIYAF